MAAKKQQTKSVTKKKNQVAVSEKGRVYITATFNNTLVSITTETGNVVSWSSSGSRGFKGARKSTPYAASLAVEYAAGKAIERGMKMVDVFIKGPGSGRESSLRGIKAAGLSISSISDITPLPHNGPKAKNRRRI